MPTFKDASVVKGPHNYGIAHASTQHKHGICTTRQSCPCGYIYFLKHVYTFLCTKSMQVVDTHSSAVKVKLTTSQDLGQRRTFHFNGGWLVQVNYCNKWFVTNHEPCIFRCLVNCWQVKNKMRTTKHFGGQVVSKFHLSVGQVNYFPYFYCWQCSLIYCHRFLPHTLLQI